MLAINKIDNLRHEIIKHKLAGKIIGLVPTMGYLHKGHLSLINQAKDECDIVVVSIFVNPLQFGKNEDLSSYPRDVECDLALCQEVLTDIVFIPEADEIINGNTLTYVDMEQLGNYLCGAKRHGHFRGVCTIVTKLFNLVNPDRAYFGMKDIQQLRIIQKMVADLNFPVKVVEVATKRDTDGLALSSRNSYLTSEERQIAVIIPQTLNYIKEQIAGGIITTNNLIDNAIKFISQDQRIKVDYIQIVDNMLQPIERVKSSAIIAIAVFVGKTRLIDNYTFN